ncbi:helicase [Bdellovibrio bacteriovorus]|uniref:helicase n=1 Tax=Bdellovibrio bacteriovorus TaxID=959 RepID=UPI0021D0E394|nr:helicase [Bdellovibrio bacteriovorus]UXR64686.1 helicase [Bdellovibrio bacteriovorus]
MKRSNELLPFTSDGCSMSPNGTPKEPEAFLQCCVRHDYHYWQGGTVEQKAGADEELRSCISNASDKKTGDLYWVGVRVGGGPEFKTPFRWGYGWRQHRGYDALSADEEEQVFTKTKDIDWDGIYRSLKK